MVDCPLQCPQMSQTQFRPSRRSWVKLWVNEWLTGTVRWQLSPSQRAMWADLLALAGYSRFPGIVCSGETNGQLEPYPMDYLCTTFRCKERDVREAFQLFETQGRIRIDPNLVIHIVNWEKYQSEYQQKRQRTRYRNAAESQPKLHSKSVVEVEGEVDVDAKKPKPSARPSLDEVKAYCCLRKNGINPDAWYAHYEANGWKVGRNPMKNWKAAIHTWEHRDGGPSKETPATDPDMTMTCSACGRRGAWKFSTGILCGNCVGRVKA